MHLYVHCGIIYNIQDMKVTYMSIATWMDKENVLSICLSVYLPNHLMEYYRAITKNETLPLVTIWMDQEGMLLVK